MIEWLEGIDRSIVLHVNSWHSPAMDEIMWFVSAKLTWIPLYLVLFYLLYRKNGLKIAIYMAISVILTIVIADLLSVYLVKEQFQRYRPSHHGDLLEKLHFYQLDAQNKYQGGKYGFVSSHATNFFALASSFARLTQKQYPKMKIALFAIAVIICFSRLYLGVHYLSDLIGGMLLGILVSLALYKWVWPYFKSSLIHDTGAPK